MAQIPSEAVLADQQAPRSEAELDDRLTLPTKEVVTDLSQMRGDLLVLGAGGKMGPTLCRLARRALDAASSTQRVIAVSRFSNETARKALREDGVETVCCDLLNRRELDSLPDCANIIYLAGMKFGSTASPHQTWQANVLAPAQVTERFRSSSIVALSTGNVYPFVSPSTRGASESTPPAPTGEYAWTALGRERMFEVAAERWGTRSVIVRLNYATDLRYGVLQDIARRVAAKEPVDVTMGSFNTIWQGDANSAILRALALAAVPPSIINLTGPDTVSVRDAAERFGALFGISPRITGIEAPTALLSDAERSIELFGVPRVSLATMIAWTAAWVLSGGRSLERPTHFEARDGQF